MSASDATSRYVVTDHDSTSRTATGTPVVIFRVFDTAKQSYPRLHGGRIIQDHYSARDHAQRVADNLNKET